MPRDDDKHDELALLLRKRWEAPPPASRELRARVFDQVGREEDRRPRARRWMPMSAGLALAAALALAVWIGRGGDSRRAPSPEDVAVASALGILPASDDLPDEEGDDDGLDWGD